MVGGETLNRAEVGVEMQMKRVAVVKTPRGHMQAMWVRTTEGWCRHHGRHNTRSGGW